MTTCVIGKYDDHYAKYIAQYYISPQFYIYCIEIHINFSAPYKQFSHKVGSTSVKTTNKSSLASQIHKINDQLNNFRCIIFVHKKSANPGNPRP